jgi:hypothetical protein
MLTFFRITSIGKTPSLQKKKKAQAIDRLRPFG